MTTQVVRNSEIFLRKLAEFLLVVCEPRKFLGNMTKKVVRNSEIFLRKCRNLFGGRYLCPQTKTIFVKWSASRKRLSINENLSHKYIVNRTIQFIHSFIHSGHFYSASSSPLLLRGAPDYSMDTISEFHLKRTGNCR